MTVKMFENMKRRELKTFNLLLWCTFMSGFRKYYDEIAVNKTTKLQCLQIFAFIFITSFLI